MKTSTIVTFSSTTFTGADIRNAIVTEDVDPLSITLPMGTLELTLYSALAAFSIINPSGDYALLENRQPLVVYEVVGPDTIFIGQFYLDTWENVSDTLIKFNCIDLLGVLGSLTYYGGLWLTPTTVGALLDIILDEVSIPYILDPDLAAVELTGWIPICSYREAVQQVAFAAGAYVTCARQPGLLKIGKTFLSGAISRGVRCGASNGLTGGSKIWTQCGQSRLHQQRFRQGTWGDLVADIVITKAEKGANQSLTLRTQVTDVEVTMHNLTAGAGSRELFNGSLDAGLHKITFSQPMHSLTITSTPPASATISTAYANYAIVSVDVGGSDVILTGLVYEDSAKIASKYTTPALPKVKENILAITNATLVNAVNGDAVALRVWNYYQQRLLQKVKLYHPVAVTGNTVVIDTLYSQHIRGVVEKMTLDLAKGFTVQAEIVGILDT